jgi:hypothetical protein
LPIYVALDSRPHEDNTRVGRMRENRTSGRNEGSQAATPGPTRYGYLVIGLAILGVVLSVELLALSVLWLGVLMRISRWSVVLLVVAVVAGLLPGTAGAAGAEGTGTRVPGAPSGLGASVVSLPCGDQIDSQATPRLSGFATVLGDVALPTGKALGAVRLADTDPSARYWAKQGIVVKAGAAFEMIVPPQWLGRLSFGWGSPATRTTHLIVSDCQWTAGPAQQGRRAPWLAFAGGYWVRDPACVSLVVKAGARTQRVRVGVGAACPGQSPPRIVSS